MSVAEQVKEARVARHMTQVEFGVKIGVSTRTVQRWESGATRPRNHLLLRLAALLGIDPGELA